MKKIFITGSEGFAGQHLVNVLKDDYSIIGLSRSEQLDPSDNVSYKIGDISDINFLNNVLKTEKPDVIFHLAAIAVSWTKDLDEVFKVNILGTRNIYEAVLKVKEEDESYNPKIFYVSTADVYGKTKNPDNITEDSPFYPINYYAVSKLAADRLSYQYSQTHNLNIIILRPFNHTGPGQRKGFFVPDMISQIVEIEKGLKPPEIMVGNLDTIKDFQDVRDVALAYKLAIEKDLEKGEAYNICTGKGIKLEDILNKLIGLSKVEIKITLDPNRVRTSDIKTLIGENRKFVEATGWEPKYTIEQTLEDSFNFWRENFDRLTSR